MSSPQSASFMGNSFKGMVHTGSVYSVAQTWTFRAFLEFCLSLAYNCVYVEFGAAVSVVLSYSPLPACIENRSSSCEAVKPEVWTAVLRARWEDMVRLDEPDEQKPGSGARNQHKPLHFLYLPHFSLNVKILFLEIES